MCVCLFVIVGPCVCVCEVPCSQIIHYGISLWDDVLPCATLSIGVTLLCRAPVDTHSHGEEIRIRRSDVWARCSPTLSGCQVSSVHAGIRQSHFRSWRLGKQLLTDSPCGTKMFVWLIWDEEYQHEPSDSIRLSTLRNPNSWARSWKLGWCGRHLCWMQLTSLHRGQAFRAEVLQSAPCRCAEDSQIVFGQWWRWLCGLCFASDDSWLTSQPYTVLQANTHDCGPAS